MAKAKKMEVVSEAPARRGKAPKFADKTALGEFLLSIMETGTTRLAGDVSYHQLRKLAAQGYLERTVAAEKKERGRHQKPFILTAKARVIAGQVKGQKTMAAKRAAKAEQVTTETAASA